MSISGNWSDSEENTYYEKGINSKGLSYTNPCMNVQQYPKCSNYCLWHKFFFAETTKEDFLTIMKYALPQRKILQNQISQYEQKLAEKIFGTDKIMKSLNNVIAPMSLVTFCHQKGKGWNN